MKELWKTAYEYHRTLQGLRLGWRGWLSFGGAALASSALFGWSGWRLFAATFARPPSHPWGYVVLIALCECLALAPFLVVVRRRDHRTLAEFRRQYPGVALAKVSDVRPLELTRITGKQPREFLALAKELAAMAAAYRACGWSGVYSVGDLLGLLYHETSKSRVPGLLACLVAAFVALVLAKQVTPADAEWLESAAGQRMLWQSLYLPLLSLALVTWGCLRVLWNVGRSMLLNLLCHLAGAAEGNEDVVNYFISDLLRFHRHGFLEAVAAPALVEPTVAVAAPAPCLPVPAQAAAPATLEAFPTQV